MEWQKEIESVREFHEPAIPGEEWEEKFRHPCNFVINENGKGGFCSFLGGPASPSLSRWRELLWSDKRIIRLAIEGLPKLC